MQFRPDFFPSKPPIKVPSSPSSISYIGPVFDGTQIWISLKATEQYSALMSVIERKCTSVLTPIAGVVAFVLSLLMTEKRIVLSAFGVQSVSGFREARRAPLRSLTRTA